MINKTILTVLTLLIANFFYAQTTDSALTLGYFMLQVDEDFRADLVDFEEVQGDVEEFGLWRDPLVAGIIDETYIDIASAVTERTNFRFLDAQTLRSTEGKRIMHSIYGYPLANMKRAATHQTSAYYARITVQIQARFGMDNNLNLGTFQREVKRYRPGVVIRLALFDENGKKIEVYKGKAKTKEMITVRTDMVARWFKIGDERRFGDDENQRILQRVINEALDNLVSDINYIESEMKPDSK